MRLRPALEADQAAKPISTSDARVPVRAEWAGPSLRKHTSAAAPAPASRGGAGFALASIQALVDAITSASSHGEGAHQAR
ncbi:hypothetical protein [Stenotrophomonas maltophilia]|uniref:hypothetical protein n=1 Tax=Stenotrophomonas maltophilia TaxID=40324 RepID=UPI0014871C12|nr:hypothetical protein [Stenotrophomonas maltophilia]